ncbi:MAG TPA: hypothetical protein VG778_11075, partial [Blastocatellia bacterium]|nr:hypothetical protein [Blastocatellia bacterium]
PKDDRAPDPSTQAKRAQSPRGERERTTPPDSTLKAEQREAVAAEAAQKPGDEKAGVPASESLDSKNSTQSEPEAQKQSESSDSKSQMPGALAGEMAQQAAKLAPGLSEQLLNKAAELRVNDLKPEDIKQLQQAAQLLARDLSRIAQSKEFQQAVDQLAKQVNPEQLEKVAEELAKQEGLKRELEAAAKLLAENQEVRQMVAGLAQQFAQQKESLRPPQSNAPGETQSLDLARGSKPEKGVGPGARRSGASKLERAYGSDRPLAGGREEVLTGKLQGRTGGEFLYLQSAPGKGASRTSYSSAYPKYRRAAERSVERSQVPARMRTVVRDYFDAINPDAKKNK